MKTVMNSKNAFILLTFGILTLLYVAPTQAQVTKRNKKSKEKTKTFIRKSNKLNDSNPGKTTFISLDHFWSITRTDNYSTANLQGKSGALSTKYRFVRTDGHIQKEPSNIEGHAVPLYLYYSNTRKDNFITASPEGIRAAETGGYRKVRIEGYVLKRSNLNINIYTNRFGCITMTHEKTILQLPHQKE